MADQNDILRKRRWKLALGHSDEERENNLTQKEREVENLLNKLYKSDRQGGLSSSRPVTARWLGKIKSLFPSSVVQVMQRDALDRFGIKKMLSQPAFLNEVEPNVPLIAAILSAKEALSPAALQSVRFLVAKLAKQVEDKLRFKLISRISGRRDHQTKIKNPRHQEIDWHETIRQNLKYYQPGLGTIIPHTIIGRPKRSNQAKQLIILVDQSASMAESFIYAGILGSIMASIRSLKTHLIIFDTEVVDLTEYLNDPVELLMRAQLGGGTNIYNALSYATSKALDDPKESWIVLISDLFEGGPLPLLIDKVTEAVNHNVHLVSLLALDDNGAPAYDRKVAQRFADLGIPSFACTPEKFPNLIAAALNQQDLSSFN